MVEHKLSIQEDGIGGLTKKLSKSEVTEGKHHIELEIRHQPCHPKSNTPHSYFATLLSFRVVKTYLVFVRAVTKTLAISYCIMSF